MRLDNKFKFKDFQPKRLQSGVVYKIEFSCGKVYIGETGRCIKTRFNEHIKISGTNITEEGNTLLAKLSDWCIKLMHQSDNLAFA